MLFHFILYSDSVLTKHCFLIVSVPELTWSDGSHDSCKFWKTTTWWRVPGPHKTKNKTGTRYQGPGEECPRRQHTQGDLSSTEQVNLFEDGKETSLNLIIPLTVTSSTKNLIYKCKLFKKFVSVWYGVCLKYKLAKLGNGATVSLHVQCK